MVGMYIKIIIKIYIILYIKLKYSSLRTVIVTIRTYYDRHTHTSLQSESSKTQHHV